MARYWALGGRVYLFDAHPLSADGSGPVDRTRREDPTCQGSLDHASARTHGHNLHAVLQWLIVAIALLNLGPCFCICDRH